MERDFDCVWEYMMQDRTAGKFGVPLEMLCVFVVVIVDQRSQKQIQDICGLGFLNTGS